MEEDDNTSNISSLADVPLYMKDQYFPLEEVFQAHSSILPSKVSAESNSDAVIQSLKALQDKIKKLEHKRVVTADRLKSLYSTSSEFRGSVEPVTTMKSSEASIHLKQQAHGDVKSRLDILDERLIKQSLDLEAMHRQLRLSGNHVSSLPNDFSSLKHEMHQAPVNCTCECSIAKEKLSILEKGVVNLERGQSLTKKKVQALEDCIDERKYEQEGGNGSVKVPMQRNHSEIATGRRPICGNHPCATLVTGEVNNKVPRKNIVRAPQASSSKGTSQVKKSDCHCLPRPIPGIHYRMNMRDVRFVVGMSATPSHSVSTNYQQVLSLMKRHSHLLCGAAAAASSYRQPEGEKGCWQSRVSVRNLKVLLVGLEEELRALTFEHQAIAQNLKDETVVKSPKMKVSLEMQLKQLEERLQSKSEQIHIVRKQIGCYSGLHLPVPKSISQDIHCEDQKVILRHRNDTQLCFLKKMKALQSTLQSEDLSWK